MLAEWTGLEPATPGVTGRGSNEHPCGFAADSYSKMAPITVNLSRTKRNIFQRSDTQK